MERRWLGPKACTILLIALGSLGCERHEEAAPAATRPVRQTLEPCRLLTVDEASSFLRGSATAVPSEKVAYASSCIWEAQNPRRGLQVMASSPAQLRADEDLRKVEGDTLEKRFAQVVQSQLGRGETATVPNLGDAAFWAGEAKQLWVLEKDRALVTVSFHEDTAPPDLFERSKAVAQKIVPRL
jgi:hypothetical protein